MPCWHINEKNFELIDANTQKLLSLEGETSLMGMDCDKGKFNLKKPSPIVTGSHLPPMESSNLKNNIPPIFIIGTCKKNQHPTFVTNS
jgi:hypothetical protein